MVKYKKIRKRFRRRYKKKFRKRFKRKYKRSRYRNFVKRKVKVKLFYSIPVIPATITGGTGGASSGWGYIKLNSLIPSGTTLIQPQYYDQLKPLYNKFRVTGAKYKIKFELKSNAYSDIAPIAGITAARGLIFNMGVPADGQNVLPYTGTGLTVDQARRVGQNPDISHKELQYSPTETRTCTFKKYVSFKKLLGSKFTLNGDAYYASDDADPANLIYLAWTATKADADILTPVTYTYSGYVVYYAECTRREFVVDV